MEQNKIKQQSPNNNHTCQNELRLKQLEQKNEKIEIIKAILTPKMFFSICLGLSMLIQALRGAY